MSFTAAREHQFDLRRYLPPGVGPAANALVGILSVALREDDVSISLGWRHALKERIADIAETCAAANWDGEDALPITGAVAATAARLVERLPEHVAHPEIGPETAGCLALDWDLGRNRILSVSVFPGRIVYAGILGGERMHGDAMFHDELPETLRGLLGRYFRRS